MHNDFRRALLASTLLVGAGLCASPALAQVPASAADESLPGDPDSIVSPTQDVIVVTGSRIARPDLEAASPVQIIGEEAIEEAGITNVQEILLENPAFGTPALSRTNSAFLTSGTGVTTVDLRDLGEERTLVLVNGRRVVGGVPGTPIVDLNVIPTQFIERVDVLTGGASAVYGSDAVAGVVNIIYKDDFEGVEGNVQYGITELGDDPRYQANVTVGGNFADDRGNIITHVGYSNEEGLLSRERENTRIDDFDEFPFSGDPDDYGVPIEPFFSSFALQGSFTAGNDPTTDANEGVNFTYSPTGQLQPCSTTNGTTCSSRLGTGVGPNGFNRQFFRTIAVPVERYLFATRARYDVTDAIGLFAEATYNKTKSERMIEPFALSSEDIFPSTGGLTPIETEVLTPVPGSPGTFTRTTVVNPLVPGPIVDAATDQDGDGLRDISFARRLGEFGTRSGTTDRDFYRFVVGLQGDIFEDRFQWEVYYNYGETTESQVSTGQVNVLNFANALQAIPDVEDLDNDGLTTDVVCASADAREQGCVPINIFGAGAISPEAVQYIQAQQTFQTSITQQVVAGTISGSLVDLPAGPLGIAAGVEYRRETSEEDNDALTNQGLNGGNALPDTSGSFDVTELFGEIRIPILADRPFFQELSIGASGRISDYSSVGTIYTYSGEAQWAPIDDVRFRGTYSRSVRAPSVGELFTGPSQTFPSGLTDPCAGIGPTGGGTRGDVCRSFPGVLANIAANGVFTLNQSDIQGISGFNSGNPDLEEETADSWTVGVVVSPRSIEALRNFTLTVDYFNISIEDAINAPPRQFILDQCFEQGEQEFCDFITRRATATATNSPGSLEFIDAPQLNSGVQETEGLDVAASYRHNLNLFNLDSVISARVAYTHYFEGFLIPVPGADPDPYVGEIGTSEDAFTATVAYSSDVLDLSFTGLYIGPADEDDQFLASFDLEPGAIGVGAEFYLDTQARFHATDALDIYVGVDNLLDNDPPNLLSGTTFNTTGTDTAADVYDVFGRRYYVGVRTRF